MSAFVIRRNWRAGAAGAGAGAAGAGAGFMIVM